MAHFAELDENNIVKRVIVVTNEDCGNLQFPESEKIGIQFLDSIGLGKNWAQASYSASFRYNFPGTNYYYDKNLDAFIPPQPYPSWKLNSSCVWEPPVPIPDGDALDYIWDEKNKTWKIIPDYEIE